ncbi:MAG: endonuclease III domain-containing protein [Candidatus Omnitrophica bacterium]|nr:endonuclease III domain-containing protein [Candidatus Omnitrophota bacterium]
MSRRRAAVPVRRMYSKLLKAFGPQDWWPGDTDFEVMVGAILTQNTNWSNVEKAIANLKKKKLLHIDRLYRAGRSRLAQCIRPAGYYNVKARRLKAFLAYLKKRYRNDLSAMRRQKTGLLRDELLSVNGIGKETADSILLYALGKPVFVVDAYTKRVLARHAFIDADADYDSVQKIFVDALVPDVKLFNEYHALIVHCGKHFCKAGKPLCSRCALKDF